MAMGYGLKDISGFPLPRASRLMPHACSLFSY